VPPPMPTGRKGKREMTTKQTITRAEADAIIAAIKAGLDTGADETDWDTPEFAEAVRLTGESGMCWDFEGWRETYRLLALSGAKPGEYLLGGVRLA
jgi:hypothetical protein